ENKRTNRPHLLHTANTQTNRQTNNGANKHKRILRKCTTKRFAITKKKELCRASESSHRWPDVRTTGHIKYFRNYGEKQGNKSFEQDRKSTRLNSSHVKTSYAVSCSKNIK